MRACCHADCPGITPKAPACRFFSSRRSFYDVHKESNDHPCRQRDDAAAMPPRSSAMCTAVRRGAHAQACWLAPRSAMRGKDYLPQQRNGTVQQTEMMLASA